MEGTVNNIVRPEIGNCNGIAPEEPFKVTIIVRGENEKTSVIIEVAKNKLFDVVMSLSGHTSVITIE